MKKKTKLRLRNNYKFPALNPSVNLKKRIEELQDIDYITKLNPKEKAWLNNFLDEWVNADLRHEGKKFHKTKKERKIIYDKNNANNRDAFSTTKALNKLQYEIEINAKENPEDAMILKYDLENNLVKRKYRK